MRARDSKPTSDSTHGIASQADSLLIISPDKNDHDLLRTVFDAHACSIDSAFNISAGLDRLREKNFAVIICERDLPDGDWKQILQETCLRVIPPALIVTSRFADEWLWAEVLNLGGYDVLAKPLDRGELLRVIGHAWSRFRNEKEYLMKREVGRAATARPS